MAHTSLETFRNSSWRRQDTLNCRPGIQCLLTSSPAVTFQCQLFIVDSSCLLHSFYFILRWGPGWPRPCDPSSWDYFEGWRKRESSLYIINLCSCFFTCQIPPLSGKTLRPLFLCLCLSRSVSICLSVSLFLSVSNSPWCFGVKAQKLST